jgi:serine/threonine protein kinase
VNKLGKFEIIAKVGQGAMGVVYKAHDPFIDRIVALETLTTGLAEDPLPTLPSCDPRRSICTHKLLPIAHKRGCHFLPVPQE